MMLIVMILPSRVALNQNARAIIDVSAMAFKLLPNDLVHELREQSTKYLLSTCSCGHPIANGSKKFSVYVPDGVLAGVL